MKIIHIDHIVLTVKDIEKTVNFYKSVLGMAKEEFGDGRVALKFGYQKINLHQTKSEWSPHAKSPIPGSADLCFIIETPLKNAMTHVQNQGVHILLGPIDRTGATGPIRSFYFRDPDGNLIEVATLSNVQYQKKNEAF